MNRYRISRFFAPAAGSLQLVTVGAHYDAVELLRPGWPMHRELDQLAARAPGEAHARVIAFGAHDDTLPGALTPQADHAGGPLRLVPFVLGGDADCERLIPEPATEDALPRREEDCDGELNPRDDRHRARNAGRQRHGEEIAVER